MSENDFNPSNLPTGEKLNESVDEILAQIMGEDGEMGESFSMLFAKYLGSETASQPPIISRDISDRTDEAPAVRQRVEYEDPDNIPPPPLNPERRINEKIPEGMKTVYSAAEEEARKPTFTPEGTVKYPIMGSGEAEERVVYDADWEENAKREANRREAYRREQMLMGDSVYARNTGFVTRSYAKPDTPSANKNRNTYFHKPNVNPAYIDPLSDVEDEPLPEREKNSRQPSSRTPRAVESRVIYEAADEPGKDDTGQNNGRTEEPVTTNPDNNSFFPEGFSAKVNNNAVGGKTEATGTTGVTAEKSIVDEAVLDAFAGAEDSEIAFRARWQSEVDKANSRKERDERLNAENQKRDEARRRREERLAARLVAESNGTQVPLIIEPKAQKPLSKTVLTTKTDGKNKKDGSAEVFAFAAGTTENAGEKQPAATVSRRIPRPERLTGAYGKLLLSGAPHRIVIKKNFSERTRYFFRTKFNKDGFCRLCRRSFPSGKDAAGEKVRKLVRIFSFIVLIGALVYLGVYGVKYVKRVKLTHDIDKQITSLEELTDEQVEEAWKNIHVQYPDVNFPTGMNVKYANLYAINQDVVGYLTIANTNIQTVLLQTENDDYYLYRDIYKAKSRYGNPFVSRYSNMGIEGLSKNTIIYGHNTHDELMFNQLTRYMTVSGYLNAPIVTMDTLYESTTWKVFAVMLTNSTPSADNGYVFDYLKTSFSSDSEFLSLIDNIYERSIINTGVDVAASDKIMMLYTCYQNIFDGGRLVVCARQLRAGEAPQIDSKKVTYNSTVHYPQAYYDAMGTENPYYTKSTSADTTKKNTVVSTTVNTSADTTTIAEETTAVPIGEDTDTVPSEPETQTPEPNGEIPAEAGTEAPVVG